MVSADKLKESLETEIENLKKSHIIQVTEYEQKLSESSDTAKAL
jgi:hypothetical protein